MKVITLSLRAFLSFLGVTFVCILSSNAQNPIVADYLKVTGDHAGIYNGQLEVVYNPRLYEGVPYYQNADFTDGSVVFKRNYYPGVQLRLDLYREQLIILTPERHFGIVLDSKDVDTVNMYNKTFVWLIPTRESGLREGYYLLLFKGQSLKILYKEKYFLNKNERISYFDQKKQYYIVFNDRYYPAKDKKSFIKVLPQYKKQINAFAKDRRLDFGQNPDKSFNLLANYCEELINSKNNQ